MKIRQFLLLPVTLISFWIATGTAEATQLIVVDLSASMAEQCNQTSVTALSVAISNIQQQHKWKRKTQPSLEVDYLFVGSGDSEYLKNQKLNFKFKRRLKTLKPTSAILQINDLLRSVDEALIDTNQNKYTSIAIYTTDTGRTMGEMLEALSGIDKKSAVIEIYLFSQTKKPAVSISNGLNNYKVNFSHCPEKDGWKAYLNELEQTVIHSIERETGYLAQPEDSFSGDLALDAYTTYQLQSKILSEHRVNTDLDSEIATVFDLVNYIAKQQQESGIVSKDGVVVADRAITKPEPDSAYVQQIFYATNRKPSNEPEVFYSGERAYGDNAIKYGACKVAIPKNHKKGSIERPLLGLRIFKDPKEHVYISEVRELERGKFFATMNQHLEENASDDDMSRHTVVFVHGFNVKFYDAVLRTAQLAHDYGFEGVPVLFSWPSDGQLLGYASDREDATWSVQYLENFLLELKEKSLTKKIHLIAHSMGNQVLLGALHQLKLKNADELFESVILAAPDYDSELFRDQVGPGILSLAKNWTIYTSENDAALEISSKVNSVQRLGSPVTQIDGVNIIDASNVEVTPWSVPEFHSYYASKQPVIDDMVATLQGVGPDKRKLKPVVTGEYRYWQFSN